MSTIERSQCVYTRREVPACAKVAHLQGHESDEGGEAARGHHPDIEDLIAHPGQHRHQ